MRVSLRLPDWVIGLTVTLVFLFTTLTGSFNSTDTIEKKAFDLRSRVAARPERNPDIELVVITENDISELGPLPWPRDIIARCINILALAGAKVIGLNLLLSEPEEGPGLTALRRLQESYELSGLAQEGAGLAFYKELSEALGNLDNDNKLHRALEKAGNVVLPVSFDTQSTRHDIKVPDYVIRHGFKRIKDLNKKGPQYELKRFSKLRVPLPSFAEFAAGMGHVNFFPDKDGCLRNQVHLLGYLKDIYFPSFPLAIVAAYRDLKPENVTVVLGEGIELKVNPSSVIRIPAVEHEMSTPITWSKGPGVAFHETPFINVLQNRIETSLFRDKIVIIGVTAPMNGERFVTPISSSLPVMEVVANSVANILNQRFIFRPHWLSNVELAILVVFGLFVTVLLPRLNSKSAGFTTLGLLFGYGSIGTILFFVSNIWLKITSPLLLLIVCYGLLVSKRHFSSERKKDNALVSPSPVGETVRLSSQQPTPFNLVRDNLRRIPRGEEEIKDFFYALAMTYEQNQEFPRALATYELIVGDGKNFKDVNKRMHMLKEGAAEVSPESSPPGRTGDLRALSVDGKPKRVFERYELMEELGRGGLGSVYRGHDVETQKIVAIKAVNFSDFGEETQSHVKDPLFRYAESTALLTHPNIVTIFDIGEEHGVAYIIMEYLEGTDLRCYTNADHLLPLRETLEIVAQVVDALNYAHDKGIVHGDIKPTNIIRIKDTKRVKVTDFGIGQLAPFPINKKGIERGLPYYMSPEQLSGKKVDGRSDVFSVGTVFFELLTGQKPFEAEDITDLMLKIAKEKHPSVKALNPSVPRIVERIADRALEKDLNKRYQSAGQMAGQLKGVVARIDAILAQKAFSAQR
jgi:CHASE2 domain-containing sensor protein